MIFGSARRSAVVRSVWKVELGSFGKCWYFSFLFFRMFTNDEDKGKSFVVKIVDKSYADV